MKTASFGFLNYKIPVCGSKGDVCPKNRLDSNMLRVHLLRSLLNVKKPKHVLYYKERLFATTCIFVYIYIYELSFE